MKPETFLDGVWEEVDHPQQAEPAGIYCGCRLVFIGCRVNGEEWVESHNPYNPLVNHKHNIERYVRLKR